MEFSLMAFDHKGGGGGGQAVVILAVAVPQRQYDVENGQKIPYEVANEVEL